MIFTDLKSVVEMINKSNSSGSKLIFDALHQIEEAWSNPTKTSPSCVDAGTRRNEEGIEGNMEAVPRVSYTTICGHN